MSDIKSALNESIEIVAEYESDSEEELDPIK